jgi:archaellum biogenesis ATPase FlaH
MGIATTKEQCPRCAEKGGDTSHDNLIIYDDGSKHCFACGYTIPSEEWLKENGHVNLQELEYELVGAEFNKEVLDKLKKNTSYDGKNYRGIEEKTSRYFGVMYKFNNETGEVESSYYPITKGIMENKTVSEALTGFKIRKHPKDFSECVGEFNNQSDLFMQWRFPTHRGMLIICAGEVDALSAYQILKEQHDKRKDQKFDEIAVVSPVTGEGGAASQLRNHFEWLSQFSKIIICMDNDDAGREATKKIAEVLPKGKAYVLPLRYKDVNKYLEENDEASFINDFWGHKPWTPDGIKSSVDGFYEIKEELLRPKITLPEYMKVLQGMMGGGIAQGRIVNVISTTSSGKTSHVRRMVHHWIFNSPVLPTIVSVEETAAQYNIDLAQIHLKKNFTFGKSTEELVDFIESEEFLKARRELAVREDGSPRFMIIDEISGDISSIENQMETMFKKHGSKLFIIDVLSDLLRGSNADKAEDHMNFQKKMAKLGCTIINVHHTIKPPRGENGKPRKVTEYDTLGTGSFVQSGHINIVLNRDKMSEDTVEKNITEAEMPKCRGGQTGQAGLWYFDFLTATCFDFYDWKEANPHRFVKK